MTPARQMWLFCDVERTFEEVSRHMGCDAMPLIISACSNGHLYRGKGKVWRGRKEPSCATHGGNRRPPKDAQEAPVTPSLVRVESIVSRVPVSVFDLGRVL